MLTKCVICGFNVRDEDEFCLNCGLISPLIPEKLSAYSFPRFIIILFSLSLLSILIFGFSIIKSGNYDKLFDLILYSFLICSFFSLIVEYFIKEIIANEKFTKRSKENPVSLNFKDKIIKKRVSELLKRGQNIDSVLDKIKENESENLQEVRRKLLTAREIVMSQFSRYELQKQKIELVRLQNGVSPYLFKLHRLNEFQTEDGLVTIENTRREINKIRTILTRFDAIEFPRNTLPEKENFLTQLSETENSCQNLREALLSKQATRALQGISPIEEKLKIPHTNELAHTAETFNLQTTLTDFSESFEELEREYRRVQSESEISQKLLNEN